MYLLGAVLFVYVIKIAVTFSSLLNVVPIIELVWYPAFKQFQYCKIFFELR